VRPTQISWDDQTTVIWVANYRHPMTRPEGGLHRPDWEPGHWVWYGPEAEDHVLRWLESNRQNVVEKITFHDGHFASMETFQRVVPAARLEKVE
jgi:hypothetical protein